MLQIRWIAVSPLITSIIFLTCSSVTADQVRYMDAAGNIHFVDKPSEVPKQYILQVHTPTPTPHYDKRALAEMKRKRMQLENDKKRAEMQKQRDLKKARDDMERQRLREEKELRRRDQSSK